ncbi:MAG: hypothetical protein IT350_03630 [Deltaproteobacteria bacterium]|nr:hypothetical protein [Deltaproteobacteria bacterium]
MSTETVPRAAYIIWGAIFASIFFYAGIAMALRMSGFAEAQGAPVEMLMAVLGSMALFVGVFSTVVVPRMLGRLPLMTYSILRAALAESVAVFGLVLMILGAPIPVGIVFFVASAILLVIVRPRPRAATAISGAISGSIPEKSYQRNEDARPIVPE